MRTIDDLTTIGAPLVFSKIPQGFFSGMQGWPNDDVYYVWLFQTPQGATLAKQSLVAGEGPPIPLFPPTTPMGASFDAIEAIFHTEGAKELDLVAAVKYLIRDSQLYIDFMAVRKGWRRRGINGAMIRTLETRWPNRALIFSPFTQDGKLFYTAFGRGLEMRWKR